MATRHRPRSLRSRHLPYIVHRRSWAKAMTLVLVPLLAALGMIIGIAAFALMPADIANDWRSGAYADAAGSVLLMLLMVGFAASAGIAATIGIDRSISYRVEITRDHLLINGALFQRRFAWGEITECLARPNYRLPGYYASFKVDGSRHPRRHWSSLWFGYYDIPPLMDFGGKELTALLRHAKRRADAGWPEPPTRQRTKAD